jgi:hypothetical protein
MFISSVFAEHIQKFQFVPQVSDTLVKQSIHGDDFFERKYVFTLVKERIRWKVCRYQRFGTSRVAVIC